MKKLEGTEDGKTATVERNGIHDLRSAMPAGVNTFVRVFHNDPEEVLRRCCENAHVPLVVLRKTNFDPEMEEQTGSNLLDRFTRFERWLYYNTTLYNHTKRSPPSTTPWHTSTYDVLYDGCPVVVAFVAMPSRPQTIFRDNKAEYVDQEIPAEVDKMMSTLFNRAAGCSTVIFTDIFEGYNDSDICSIGDYVEARQVDHVFVSAKIIKDVTRDHRYAAYHKALR